MLAQLYTLNVSSFSGKQNEFGLYEEEEHSSHGCYQHAYQNADIFLESNNVDISDPEPCIRISGLTLLKKRKNIVSSSDFEEQSAFIQNAESKLLLRRKLIPKKLTLYP